MSTNRTPTLLVTGASGQLGRRIVELLVERKAGTIIATTRNPEKLADLSALGVEVRKADFDAPETLADAFTGADRMLIVSTDSIDRPGHRFEQHERAINAAVKAEVGHIIYTSLTHPVDDSPVLIAPDHVQTEAALEASGLGYTALRNNLYTDLLLMSLPAAIAMGKLFSAAGEEGAAYVTREDCARAAAAALCSSFEGKRQLEVSGPEVVTYAELAVLASDISGQNVASVALEPAALKGGMTANGLPEEIAALMVSFDEGMAKGLFGPATATVEELTGQKPTTVRSFLENHRAALTP